MNRFIPSTEDTLLFRMSRNAEDYPRHKGCFEVQYNKVQRRVFNTLVEAFLFYFTLEEEATLWDKTHTSVLIETKVTFHLN